MNNEMLGKILYEQIRSHIAQLLAAAACQEECNLMSNLRALADNWGFNKKVHDLMTLTTEGFGKTISKNCRWR